MKGINEYQQSKYFEISRYSAVLCPELLESFWENGFVVVRGFVDVVDIISIRERVSLVADREREAGKAHFYGDNLQRVWNLLNKGDVFHELLLSAQIDLLMSAIFDRATSHRKFFLSSFQANILHPGAKAQILHVDTPVPDPLPDFIVKANVIWALDNCTRDNGATQVIPGSHRFKNRPPRDPTPDEQSRLVAVEMPAGSVLVTHGALWHRSGDNGTRCSRRVLLSSFAASYAREISSEDDTVRFLGAEARRRMDPRLLSMIGANHGVKPGNDYEMF